MAEGMERDRILYQFVVIISMAPTRSDHYLKSVEA